MKAELLKKIWFKILLWILVVTLTSTTSIILYNLVTKKDVEENNYQKISYGHEKTLAERLREKKKLKRTVKYYEDKDNDKPGTLKEYIAQEKKERKQEGIQKTSDPKYWEQIKKDINVPIKKKEISTELSKHGFNLSPEYIPDEYATDRVLKNISEFIEKTK